MSLVLASGSPRRAELLERLGLRFEVVPADIDETRRPDEPPAAYVERLATEKALAVVEPGRLVLAADTAVVHEGRVLGKPAHPEEARSMLRSLQGDAHDVFTGVAVGMWDGASRVESMVDITEVTVMTMTEEEIADYVASGEPMDKAGAYGLQGAGGRFIESVKGSPFTVIGLPIHLLSRMVGYVGDNLNTYRNRVPQELT